MGCHPCHLHDFFYFYSLQVGTMVVSWAGITLLCTSIIVNLVNNDWGPGIAVIIVQCLVILFFFIITFLSYALGIAAAFKVSKDFALAATLAQSFQFFTWLCLAILSFSDFFLINRFICVGNRCADRFFIQEAHWRTYWEIAGKDDNECTILIKFATTFSFNKFDADFILSIIFVVIIAVFYVYTIMIFASYRNLLKVELEDSRTYLFTSRHWDDSV